MNNDNLAPEEEPGPAASLETGSRGLAWRIIIAVLAVIIIGVLAYNQFAGQQSSASPVSSTSVSPVAQATVSAPEATAQANPDSAVAQFDLGNAYVKSGQWVEAQAAFQKVIELDPNFQRAYANLGVVYYQLEQLDLAASQYKKALELDPNDGDVAYNLGALYLQQALINSSPPDPELVNQAIIQLKQAAEINPTLAEPYFGLGVAYNALNQKDQAIEAFETFLARDTGTDPRAGQEANRYLEALRNQ